MEFVIATVNRLRPAFLIFEGDLVVVSGDPARAGEYFGVTGKSDSWIRLDNLPGNHDVGYAPTEATRAAFREKFGPDYYTFRVGVMAAFVLNSCLIAGPGNVPDELVKPQAWLREELAKTKQDGMRHLVVFQHYLIFIESPDEKHGYYTLPFERHRECLDLFCEAGLSYVFSGHYHPNVRTAYGPLRLVTTTAISCADTQSGIRVVTGKDSGIETRSYDCGALPTRVHLGR